MLSCGMAYLSLVYRLTRATRTQVYSLNSACPWERFTRPPAIARKTCAKSAFAQPGAAMLAAGERAGFDGDGRADVAMQSLVYLVTSDDLYYFNTISWEWKFSRDGVQDWTSHQITWNNQCNLVKSFNHQQQLSRSVSSLAPGIGRFGGNPLADILVWNGNELCIVSGGREIRSPSAPGYALTQRQRRVAHAALGCVETRCYNLSPSFAAQ
jgi:hypothetical protein